MTKGRIQHLETIAFFYKLADVIFHKIVLLFEFSNEALINHLNAAYCFESRKRFPAVCPVAVDRFPVREIREPVE